MPDVLVTPDVLLMGDSDVESADSTPNGWVPPRVEKAYDNWQYAGRQKMERITGAIQKAMIETPAIDYAELVSTRDGIWTFFHDKKKLKEYTNDRVGYTDWVEDMANCARTRKFPGLERRLRRYLMSALEDLDVEDLVAEDDDTDYDIYEIQKRRRTTKRRLQTEELPKKKR